MLYIVLAIAILAVLVYFIRTQTFLPQARTLTRGQENANLVKVLLELEPGPREELFKLYKDQFGVGAARYAQQTYQKWKDGSVKPNKQTFRRFLINLPRVMSFDLKCEVLRELREAYCAKDSYRVTVRTDDWKETLTPIVEAVLQKALTTDLPESLRRRLTWLAEDDVAVAKAILVESEARQTRNALTLLENEFSNIEELLNNARGRGKVTHDLRLPMGTITIQIEKGNRNG
jgi:hypothetical protein